MNRRRRPSRPERQRGLIVTEGVLTEPMYLDKLKQALPRRAPSFKHIGAGCDPLRVVKRAVRELGRDDFSWCFCLVDVDQHATLQEAITLAEVSGVELIVSNPNFEVWLAWHFAPLSRCVTKTELARLLDDKGGLDGKGLTRGFPVDAHDLAAERALTNRVVANEVGPNPSSAMPLVLRRLGLLD